MKDRYVINKFGLVNFWYYDMEEFQLSEGNLLLRGSNGSGKSVTMQSFIPLLLDGNKSPERIDPFGTKSRTITNYLLDEDTDEKTAYLYMEFKRKNSDYYITIGMGIKAIKNKPPQSWYFILSDGRRINKDLFLYRNAGELIPLTKKQLENELGEGNFYTESQGKYMEKVNEYLFGFDDIEAYEELLNLLISIRSPKLSKDFKPTEIYKILTDSLKVLSDDDLRPISDSMENMDNLKNSLEENERALKCAKNIKYYYDKYNTFILVEKAKSYIDKHKIISDSIKDIKNSEKEIKSLLTKKEELMSTLHIKENELRKAEEIYEKLRDREEFKFKKQLIELEEKVDLHGKDKKRKEEQLENKKHKAKAIDHELKDANSQLEQLTAKLKENIKNLEVLAEESCFEAGKGIEVTEILNIEPLIKSYESKVKDGIAALKELEIQKEKVSNTIKEKDYLEAKFYEEKKNMITIEELFLTEKENYKVSINDLNKENRLFILNEEEKKELFKEVEKVEEPYNIQWINNKINDFYKERENEYKGNIHIEERIIEELENEINALEMEIENIKSKKEVEPYRSEGVLKNRERLAKENIPFIPLYRAIDFNKNISEEIKNHIEASLVDMGLIDALIIDEKYRHKALDFKEGMEDKYIFANANLLSFNLTNFLKVDKDLKEEIPFAKVDEVLQSIFLEEGNDVFINESGHYKLGILRGKSSNSYLQKYIGESSRKKHKEEIIREKTCIIEEYNNHILKHKESIEYIKNNIRILNTEYEKAPGTEGINTALKLLLTQQIKLKELDENLIKINNIIFEFNEKLEEVKNKVYSKIYDINLPHQVKEFEIALEVIGEYKDELNKSIILWHQIISKEENLRNRKDEYDALLKDMDDFYYEINILNNNLEDNKIKILSIKEALSKTNVQEIEKEMDNCINVKKHNPLKITELKSSLVEVNINVNIANGKIKDMSSKLEEENNNLQELEEIFNDEYNLGYMFPKEEGSTIEKCKEALNNLGEINNKNRESISNDLIESLNKNSSDLREYGIKLIKLFVKEDMEEDKFKDLRERTDLSCRVQGKDLNFLTLIEEINKSIEELKLLISDEERRVFEEVLMNTISVKVRGKIHQSRAWVDVINKLMEDMDTSSTLKLSLTWTPNKAQEEGQLHVSELIDIMSRGDRCTQQELKKLADHFTLKVREALRKYEGSGEVRNYHSIIKEVLDYRHWYEFKLHFTKKNERKKELTNNEFFRFSGGEKAMSMYIPLFSALYARYEKARKECPRVIAMDEAFAGVDEENIRDMFRLLNKLDLDYVLNSQILWGDYDTVPDLSIYELIREDNDKLVTILRYHWNGKEKSLIL